METKEQRIRKITHMHYSRPEIQKIIFDFSKNREVVPRYFEGFGRRPDAFQYPGDLFELVKNGATSFHCSEEIWANPLELSTSLNQHQMNDLRIGWDLLIDIDCKYFDFSKKAAISVISVLKKHGVKNIGIKFSGSKGFHIIVPWKAFPKTISGEQIKNLFPEVPKKLVSYIRFKAEDELKNLLSEDYYRQFKTAKIKRGIKCNNCRELAQEYNLVSYVCENSKCLRMEERKTLDSEKNSRCPECNSFFEIKEIRKIYECRKCDLDSKKNKENFSKDVEIDLFSLMELDLVLVSPRHLFRAPYSLHEKTSLVSTVISEEEVQDFHPKDANPLKIKIRDFIPDSVEGEASELLIQALDYAGINSNLNHGKVAESREFKPIKILKLSDSYLPPSIQKILNGVDDGRKRALFILLNLFRSIGMEKEELEKRIYAWNSKNKILLKEGYIKSQLAWSYRNKPVLPPNFDRDYYRAIGIIPTSEELKLKNPVNYISRESQKKSDNFKK